jgi:hypothetical protein
MEAVPIGVVAVAAELAPVAAPTAIGAIERYVTARFGRDVHVRAVSAADGDAGEKGFGYGRPVRVTLDGLAAGSIGALGAVGEASSIVVHVARGGGFGHDSLADKASLSLLAWESFGAIPRHVRPLDVGVVERDGSLRSLAGARDFFFVTEWAEGRPYFHDLDEIAARGALIARDRTRLDRLVDNLADVHGARRVDPEAYRRRTRDLFGHHECIPGLLDSYDGPAGRRAVAPATLLEIERRCVRWRWLLKERTHRLARVHGDYHPWNLLFHDGPADADALVSLDASRGIWGEPADDLAALSINYLFWAVRTRGAFVGPFAELWTRFYDAYLARTHDREVLEVIPPYLVWRALVVASPVWYPHYSTLGVEPARHAGLDEQVRRTLFRFIDRVLDVDRLEPGAVGRLLASTSPVEAEVEPC